jgi:mxaJ protein
VKRKQFSLVGSVLILTASLLFGSASGGEVKELRVCADPNNLPFSNEKLEGFENRIAEVIAKDLGSTLSFTWWPHQRGLVRRILNTGQCDVLIGIPKGYDPVLWTRPYYRTAYVMAFRKDRGFQLRSLDDPALRSLKIGVHTDTPPHQALAQRGMTGDNVIQYPLFYDSRFHPEDYTGKLMEDLIAGEFDVAIAWGPVAGYFAKKRAANFLELVPLEKSEAGVPFAYAISMGVRKGNKELKAQLEEVLGRREAEIRKILEDYGVPILAVAEEKGGGVEKSPAGQGHHGSMH